MILLHVSIINTKTEENNIRVSSGSKIIMAMKLAYGPVHHGYIKNHI